MDTSKLVVKDNALIDACFNLSLVEQRLLLLAITEARKLRNLAPVLQSKLQHTSIQHSSKSMKRKHTTP